MVARPSQEDVQRLGLKTTLTERSVGEDQGDIIVQRATWGQTEGPLYDAVKKLTKKSVLIASSNQAPVNIVVVAFRMLPIH
jgi:hypothetical protein